MMNLFLPATAFKQIRTHFPDKFKTHVFNDFYALLIIFLHLKSLVIPAQKLMAVWGKQSLCSESETKNSRI